MAQSCLQHSNALPMINRKHCQNGLCEGSLGAEDSSVVEYVPIRHEDLTLTSSVRKKLRGQMLELQLNKLKASDSSISLRCSSTCQSSRGPKISAFMRNTSKFQKRRAQDEGRLTKSISSRHYFGQNFITKPHLAAEYK